MTYSVYGLRVKGDIELRYVGMTTKTPESRIKFETGMARLAERTPHYQPLPADGISRWLLDNEIEGIVLATVPTLAEVRVKEREMVVLFARLGHRLFNTWLVPREIRQARQPREEAA